MSKAPNPKMPNLWPSLFIHNEAATHPCLPSPILYPPRDPGRDKAVKNMRRDKSKKVTLNQINNNYFNAKNNNNNNQTLKLGAKLKCYVLAWKYF